MITINDKWSMINEKWNTITVAMIHDGDDDVSRPQIQRPQISRPHISRPQLSQRQISRPHISRPHISRPNISVTHISKPQISQRQISRPHISRPHISRPNISVTHISRPHISRPHISRPNCPTSPCGKTGLAPCRQSTFSSCFVCSHFFLFIQFFWTTSYKNRPANHLPKRVCPTASSPQAQTFEPLLPILPKKKMC